MDVYQGKLFSAFLVRMALYQVPCKTMVTLNLSSDYGLDNNTMFQMPHGTIKHIFF